MYLDRRSPHEPIHQRRTSFPSLQPGEIDNSLQGNNEMELAEAEFILESLLDRISRLRKIKQAEPVSPPVSAPVGGKASYYSPQVGPKPPFLMMG